MTEQLKADFKTTFRTTVEVTDTSSRRYVLENKTDILINYELRRKMRKVGVQLQHIGTQLCWQRYIDQPNQSLALADLVHLAQPGDWTLPKLTLPPQPPSPIVLKGKVPTGRPGPEKVIAPPSPGYTLASVDIIDSAKTEAWLASEGYPTAWAIEIMDRKKALIRFVADISISFVAGDEADIELTWNPPDAAESWNAWKVATIAALQDQRLSHEDYLARVQSRIKAARAIAERSPDDLRQEERQVVARRLMNDLTAVPVNSSPHVTIELIQTVFDLDSLLYFVAPSWWAPHKVGSDAKPAPKLNSGSSGLWVDEFGNYLISEDSIPAPLGASLGWDLQLDGDPLRNAFLNTPWIKAVIPIRHGMELDALAWLQQEHVEGTGGLVKAGKPTALSNSLDALAKDVSTQAGDMNSLLHGERVYEHGFENNPSGFTVKPMDIFDQWIEVLPTDQVVALEYVPKEHLQ